MAAAALLLASIATQVVSAHVAGRLAVRVRLRAGWLALAVAMFLMAVRRSITLWRWSTQAQPIDAVAETVALVISLLALAGIYGIAREILTTEKAKEDAEAGEQRFRALFDNPHTVTLIVDPDTLRIVEANRGAVEFYGYSKAELKDMHMSDLNSLPPEENREIFLRALDGTKQVRRVQHVLADGTIRDVDAYLQPATIGARTLIYDVVHDVTDRLALERANEDQRLQLASLVNHMQSAFAYHELVLDEAGAPVDYEFLYVNDAFGRLTGLAQEDVVGRRVLEVMPQLADEDFDWIGFYARVAETGLADTCEQYVEALGRWYSVSAYSFERDRFATVFQDVTSSKEFELELERLVAERTEQLEQANAELHSSNDRLVAANAQLQEARAEKERLFAFANHELRTPLNSILGFSGILLQGLSGGLNEEQRTQISFVNQSGLHLLNLVNDLLELTRIDAKRMEATAEDFSFADLMRSTVETMRPVAQAKGLDLEIVDSRDCPCDAHSDPTRIRQVILNLLGNAIKYTNEGVVRATNRCTPDIISFDVEDTGPGIPPEEIAHVFEPFCGVGTNGGETHLQSTGLGLAVTKRLVDLLGGEIAVNSEQGVGSTFTVSLPALLPGADDR